MDGELLAQERNFREHAFTWLAHRVDESKPWISWSEILDFKNHDPDGRALVNRPQGIWKPAGLTAALSIKTRPPEKRTDRTFNYEDAMARDGLVAYKMQATNETHNNWVRRTHALGLPMIYFMGQRQSTYLPIFPVYVSSVDEINREFLIDIRDVDRETQPDFGYMELSVEYQRSYAQRLVKQRLHQPAFRSAVMMAYKESCAMCSLRHLKLLEAAHIRSDSDGGGARVSNGMALCKIHHAAYDKNFLGIDADYKVHVRGDLLQEVDGPILKYGLQALQDQKLRQLPTSVIDRPDRDLLAERFAEFENNYS